MNTVIVIEYLTAKGKRTDLQSAEELACREGDLRHG